MIHEPVATITSDHGDVRLIYLTSETETVDKVDAHGQVTSTTSLLTRTLEIAWPDGGGFGAAALADLGTAASVCAGVCKPAHAVVDVSGRIHVLAVAGDLRYLAFAP